LAWNSLDYFDLDALGCKQETANDEWWAATSERELATGEMRIAARTRLAPAGEAQATESCRHDPRGGLSVFCARC